MSPLKITARDAAIGPVVEVFGELDHSSAIRLRELIPTIELRPGQRLVMDLSGMEFCDSSGITALIAAHHHAQAARADLALAAVPAHTLRILRVVGLDQILPILPAAASDDGGSETGTVA
ncbi:STAS domain-containing protein [Streptomyces tirandamycinicus]|uniref:STAS domain-containing protein n=1 Tax=Streptomyces tirandamycinicus TaxID=2174846 RepID=UPI0022716FF5|nr:STAS domain-containing protein [Streptomyces tirandamycinicus]MCY0980294.1 STAS domain-containing protein [Streptomyces tirandamycinicus]